MHKDRIAEWILGLVTTPERAASTVGDLTESAAHHGGLWFWSHVLRTAGAMMWQTFIANPGTFLKVGFLGSLRAYILANLAQLAAVFGFMIIAGVGHAIFGPPGPLRWPNIIRGWVLWLYYLAIFAAPVLAMHRAGQWAARKVPGAEVTAGLVVLAALLVFGTAASFAIVALDRHGLQETGSLRQIWFPWLSQPTSPGWPQCSPEPFPCE